jgi:hypothetical protein
MQDYFCSAQLLFASLLEGLAVPAGIRSNVLAILHKKSLLDYLDFFLLLIEQLLLLFVALLAQAQLFLPQGY